MCPSLRLEELTAGRSGALVQLNVVVGSHKFSTFDAGHPESLRAVEVVGQVLAIKDVHTGRVSLVLREHTN